MDCQLWCSPGACEELPPPRTRVSPASSGPPSSARVSTPAQAVSRRCAPERAREPTAAQRAVWTGERAQTSHHGGPVVVTTPLLVHDDGVRCERWIA
eukprot:scaffold2357_cov399-Prasinococcus_capsulatus_cf.AAC.6